MATGATTGRVRRPLIGSHWWTRMHAHAAEAGSHLGTESVRGTAEAHHDHRAARVDEHHRQRRCCERRLAVVACRSAATPQVHAWLHAARSMQATSALQPSQLSWAVTACQSGLWEGTV